jgi:hypothetical protein
MGFDPVGSDPDMVSLDSARMRGSIEEIAGSLQQLVQMATETHQRRQLAQCAARLQAVARTIRPEPIEPVGRRQEVVVALHRAADVVAPLQRSSLLLLGLLLTSPGESVPSRTIASSIGISQQSVRVFAFHLRKWLEAEGHSDALRSQWGLGYLIMPRPADALQARWPALAGLVRAIAAAEAEELRQAA